MHNSKKPRVLISRCLGFEKCRWNGVTIHDPIVRMMLPHVDAVTPCPESDIGLGVPRDPIRIVQIDGQERLIQPKTGRDFTDEMVDYSKNLLAGLGTLDGCVLKSKSPSCGIAGARVYRSAAEGFVLRKRQGIFAEILSGAMDGLPVEDEGRLTNFTIREHFFKRIFLNHGLRQAEEEKDIGLLNGFHVRNRLLFLEYGIEGKLSDLIQNPDGDTTEILSRYKRMMNREMQSPPGCGATLKVLEHIFSRFSDRLPEKETGFFWSLIRDFEQQKVPISSLTALLKGFVIRFSEEDLASQSFFEPFPAELVDLSDSARKAGLCIS